MRPEQRRAHRIPVELEARLRSGSVSLDGRVRDLSARGGFFLVRPFDHSMDVTVEIDLPDAEPPLVVVGEVCRVDPRGVGIRFSSLPHGARRRLANFVIDAFHRGPIVAPRSS